MTFNVLESLRQDQLLNMRSPLLKNSEFQASDSRAFGPMSLHGLQCLLNLMGSAFSRKSREQYLGKVKDFFPQLCSMGFHSFMARISMPGTISRAGGSAVKYSYHLYPRGPTTLLRALPVIIFIIWPN